MRALSVKQPWAELIARGVKTLEIRSWSTKYRGPVLIISSASRAFGPIAADWGHITGPTGVTVCIAELINCREFRRHEAGTAGPACIDIQHGFYAWELRNVTRTGPVPVRGQLSLFTPPKKWLEEVIQHPKSRLKAVRLCLDALSVQSVALGA